MGKLILKNENIEIENRMWSVDHKYPEHLESIKTHRRYVITNTIWKTVEQWSRTTDSIVQYAR